MSDAETFSKVSAIFSEMHKPRDGFVKERALKERSQRQSKRYRETETKCEVIINFINSSE